MRPMICMVFSFLLFVKISTFNGRFPFRRLPLKRTRILAIQFEFGKRIRPRCPLPVPNQRALNELVYASEKKFCFFSSLQFIIVHGDFRHTLALLPRLPIASSSGSSLANDISINRCFFKANSRVRSEKARRADSLRWTSTKNPSLLRIFLDCFFNLKRSGQSRSLVGTFLGSFWNLFGIFPGILRESKSFR